MKFKVGVIGATGAVGVEVVKTLKKRQFPVQGNPVLFASERSAGKTLETEYGPIVMQSFDLEKARALDVVFLAVSGDFAREHARAIAAEGGALVIDNSSAFRYTDDVPLIVPEINADAAGSNRLIANPNCTTAIAAVALWPLHLKFGLKRVIVSTYQAASGAGAEGLRELSNQARQALAGETVENQKFSHQLAFNVIPHIDSFQENGYTREEMKVAWETRKILRLPNVLVSCTAVRVPTLRAHAEAITIETEKPIDVAAARDLLANAKGVKLVDDPSTLKYPMPLNASECYDVEVGRIRQSLVFGDCGLDFFVCGDQLLKGAALNAVQIAEACI